MNKNNYETQKFDITKALYGAKVVTRQGKEVNIVHYKGDAPINVQPVVGWVNDDLLTWWDNGQFSRDRSESLFDIFILEPNDNIGFINIHEDKLGKWADETIYPNYTIAVENGGLSETYKGTIEISLP